MALPSLPFEVIIDILSRLTVKPLARFKCVSKLWYSLIESPDFVKLHLSQARLSNAYPNLIISQYSLASFSAAAIFDKNDCDIHFSELDHPLKRIKGRDKSKFLPQILGSCNGVVCISAYDKSSVFLYNPSTKTHRLVPPFTPPNTNPLLEVPQGVESFNLVTFGLGYDVVQDDIKLMRIIEKQTWYRRLLYREASVYSVKSNSWKLVNDQTSNTKYILQKSTGVFVHESLHFMHCHNESPNCDPIIKCFNLRSETFSFVECPQFDVKFTRTYIMRELGGCLCIMANFWHDHVKALTSDQVLAHNKLVVHSDLWVMKEYGNNDSWFKLFSSDPGAYGMSPLVYSRDGERVLVELSDLSYAWYAWGSKKFEKFTVHGRRYVYPPNETRTAGYKPDETWILEESLVLLQKGKATEQSKATTVPKKSKRKNDTRDFLSTGFKLKLLSL